MPELYGHNGEVRTHPYVRVDTDGRPENTSVVLVGSDGFEVDITRFCTSVHKEAGSPLVEVKLFALAPRSHLHDEIDEFEREFKVVAS